MGQSELFRYEDNITISQSLQVPSQNDKAELIDQ